MSSSTTANSTLQRFTSGDIVKVTLPSSSNMSKYNDKKGEIVEVFRDHLGKITGNPRDSFCYIIKFEDGSDFRARDSDISLATEETED